MIQQLNLMKLWTWQLSGKMICQPVLINYNDKKETCKVDYYINSCYYFDDMIVLMIFISITFYQMKNSMKIFELMIDIQNFVWCKSFNMTFDKVDGFIRKNDTKYLAF